MIDYLKLVISPSNFIDNQQDKKLNTLTCLLIWILATLSLTLSKNIILMKTSPFGLAHIFLHILVLACLYYPVVYGFSYAYWIIGKGFKGIAKFSEIQNLFVYSLIPLTIYLPFSLIFIIIGSIKADNGLIIYNNQITQFIIGMLSFRILITGIAKLNKFNWAIALINWIIVMFVIGGTYYLIKH